MSIQIHISLKSLRNIFSSQYDRTMDVSNLLGHLLINPTSLCLRQNLQVPQLYLSSLVSYSGENSPSVTLFVPNQQNEEEAKSDGDDGSDDCEDDESSNDADYVSGTENEEGKESEGGRRGKGKSRPKCIHRTR